MIAKALMLFLWFPLTFMLLIINLHLSLQLAGRAARQPEAVVAASIMPVSQYIAAGGSGQVLGTTVIAADARPFLLKSFLEEHRSPLADYAELIVEEADRQQLDFRLLPAIAMCESNAGKRIPHSTAYNAWGIRCFTGQEDKCAKFRDWPHAISWVTDYLKERYFDRGINKLTDIGSIWAPPTEENGAGWSNCVGSFMAEIR